MSGKEILPTDKKRVNICLLLLIVKTHLMVLLYFVFLRSSNYFKKWISWKSDLPWSFFKAGLIFLPEELGGGEGQNGQVLLSVDWWEEDF